jgi:glutathione peroxidase
MGTLFFKKGKDKLGSTVIQNFKEIVVKDIDGNEKKISDYFNPDTKAAIIVNTASSCGLTGKNFKGLVELYNKYKDKGLTVLAFPCNQFMGQESKCEIDIKNYAKDNFKAEFPMFSKIEINGPSTHPLFTYLKYNNKKFNEGKGELKNIAWNFGKFLVNNEGKVIEFYDPTVSPSEIEKDLLKLI